MKNTMCPSPSTTAATTALALSLLKAPALSAAEVDKNVSSNTASPSNVENALLHGTAHDALQIIEGSGLKGTRPEVVEKEMASVVEKVVKDLMLQGKVEDAQRVTRIIRETYPEGTRIGILRAFATLDTESFTKFCDQSIIYGLKPHLGLESELNKRSSQLELPPSKTAEMAAVMDAADVQRAKTQFAVCALALGAVGIAAKSGASTSPSGLSRIGQTIGGAFAIAASTVVFCSLFGEAAGLMSLHTLGMSASVIVSMLGIEQMFKGLGFTNRD